jgi:hypothetical protein
MVRVVASDERSALGAALASAVIHSWPSPRRDRPTGGLPDSGGAVAGCGGVTFGGSPTSATATSIHLPPTIATIAARICAANSGTGIPHRTRTCATTVLRSIRTPSTRRPGR